MITTIANFYHEEDNWDIYTIAVHDTDLVLTRTVGGAKECANLCGCYETKYMSLLGNVSCVCLTYQNTN